MTTSPTSLDPALWRARPVAAVEPVPALTALRSYLAGRLSRDGLFRALAEAPVLLTPAARHCAELIAGRTTRDGVDWIELFTSRQACDHTDFLAESGVDLLRSPPVAAQGLSLDPRTSDQLSLARPQLDQLTDWARAVHIERWLDGEDVWGPGSLLRSFRSWCCGIDAAGALFTVTGPSGRLVVMCTAPDAEQAFRAILPTDRKATWTPSLVQTAVLVDALRASGADGVLVNPAGPRGPWQRDLTIADSLAYHLDH